MQNVFVFVQISLARVETVYHRKKMRNTWVDINKIIAIFYPYFYLYFFVVCVCLCI